MEETPEDCKEEEDPTGNIIFFESVFLYQIPAVNAGIFIWKAVEVCKTLVKR